MTNRLARHLRSSAARGADALGLGHHVSSGDFASDLRRLARRSAPAPGSTLTNPVLFTNVRGIALHPCWIPALLASALRLRDVGGVALLCDGALPVCETACANDYSDPSELLDEQRPRGCSTCFGVARTLVEAMGMPWIPLSRYVRRGDREHSEKAAELLVDLQPSRADLWTYSDLPLGEHVLSSLYRYFLVGELEDSATARRVSHRYASAAALLNLAMERAFLDLQPRRVVAHHGIYLIGGVARETARKLSIPFAAWDAAYRANSVIFSHGDTYHRALPDEPTSDWENRELSPDEQRTLRDYLDSKRTGSLDYVTYNPRAVHEEAALRDEFGIAPSLKCATLFTNVAWDGRVHGKNELFNGPLEWLVQTVDALCRAHPTAKIIVRVHPAEIRNPDWRSNQRADDVLRQRLTPLPTNVVIVPPEHPASSYTLAEIADVSLVYSSKMGLEVLAMGKPVIIAGDALFSGQGIGVEPRDVESYWQALSRAFDLPPATRDQMTRIERYAFHFFFRRVMQLPVPHRNPMVGLRPIRTFSDLVPGRYESLDCLCLGLSRGTPFRLA